MPHSQEWLKPDLITTTNSCSGSPNEHQLAEVARRRATVDNFKGNTENFETNSALDWQPVQFPKYGRDVVT